MCSELRASSLQRSPPIRTPLAIFERLAKADPGNARRQHDLCVVKEMIGDVLRAQGNLPDALAALKASLAIRERLTAADPGNAEWQRSLSVAQEKLGDVLRAQRNLPDSLAVYEASLAICARLAEADHGNAEWQRDLSVTQGRIGDVLVAQGKLPDALAAFKASLAIRERLTAADPENVEWKRDLALSHGRIAMALARQGERQLALDAFGKGREIIAELRSRSPDNAALPNDLAWLDGQIARLNNRDLKSLGRRCDRAICMPSYCVKCEVFVLSASKIAILTKPPAIVDRKVRQLLAHVVGLRHRTITVAIEDRPDQVPPGQEFIKRDLACVSRCSAVHPHRRRAIRSYKGTIPLCAPSCHRMKDDLDSLDKEALIQLVLAQTDTIAALTGQVEMLTTRLSRLETDNASLRAENAALREKLKLPAKTPDNSSTPPSQGKKPSGDPAVIGESKGRRTTHPGVHRPLHPNPTSKRDVLSEHCPHCGTDVWCRRRFTPMTGSSVPRSSRT